MLEASYHLPPGHLLTQHFTKHPTCKTPQNLQGNLSVWEALKFLPNWFQHGSSGWDDLFWQHELNIKAIHMAGHVSGDFTQGPQEGPFPQQFWTDRKRSVSQEILEIQALKGAAAWACVIAHMERANRRFPEVNTKVIPQGQYSAGSSELQKWTLKVFEYKILKSESYQGVYWFLEAVELPFWNGEEYLNLG